MGGLKTLWRPIGLNKSWDLPLALRSFFFHSGISSVSSFTFAPSLRCIVSENASGGISLELMRRMFFERSELISDAVFSCKMLRELDADRLDGIGILDLMLLRNAALSLTSAGSDD